MQFPVLDFGLVHALWFLALQINLPSEHLVLDVYAKPKSINLAKELQDEAVYMAFSEPFLQ